MNAYTLLTAVGDVDPAFINQAAAEPVRDNRRRYVCRAAAAAACLCVAVLTAVWIAKPWQSGKAESEPAQAAAIGESATASQQASQSHESDPPAQQDQTDEGVYIPAMELPDHPEGVEADMIAFVVWQGGIYTQAADYFGADAEAIDDLVGTYIGYATGSIDEWSEQDAYEQELAGSVAGELYAVKGYDTDFRLCLRREVQDENGAPMLHIQFLDRLNDITLNTGADLFEKRLALSGRVEQIRCQSHDDWNYNLGGLRDPALPEGLWEAFLEQVDEGSFVNTWMPGQAFYPEFAGSSIYDTPNQTHLFLTMTDGTVIPLRLIEGGYVGYGALGWYFVRIPGEVFDAVYDACGGARVTDWIPEGK